MAAADKVEPVLVHGQAGDAVQVGHHAVDQLAGVVVVEPDVAVLVAGDSEGKCGVREDRVDWSHSLARHRVLGRVQPHHDGPSLGLVDDGGGRVEGDDDVAEVPGDPVTGGGRSLLRLAERGHQGRGGGRGPEFDRPVSRAGEELVAAGVVAEAPHAVAVAGQHVQHHASVVGVVRINRGRGKSPAAHGAVNPARETEVPGTGDTEAQDGACVASEGVDRLNIQLGRLLGSYRLLEVPHLQSLVLAGCDQDGLRGVKCQAANSVKVRPQSVLCRPGLAKSLF